MGHHRDYFSKINAILNLASGSVGPHLVEGLFRGDGVRSITEKIIHPHYKKQADEAQRLIQKVFGRSACRPKYHQCEGSMFLWLWLENSRMNSLQLYEELKSKGTLVVSGHYFFPGLKDQAWNHPHECLRVNFAHDLEAFESGLIDLRTILESS
ncbi:MAG: hypothetical protein COV44_06670 [Deltaproteobacteria bacterium CG11_big_fil_rev_8_21_14_0_20_45_16]|nr:MAG: hypothetical protein COV44_06670 [Deltaproteobacteria bacterium CG11_big_fil_rev_8_21_14_0_20_45_16]